MSENVKNVFNTSRFQRGNTADDRSEKPRIMMHLDMDAFFVNVELLNKPELHGTPIIVSHEGPRSVVCSASYGLETRVFIRVCRWHVLNA